MLILSQDKNKILNFKNINTIYAQTSGRIVSFDNTYKSEDDFSDVLGEYATEERAKEVLQEIIKKYIATESFKITINRLSDELGAIAMKSCFVYEMPEK